MINPIAAMRAGIQATLLDDELLIRSLGGPQIFVAAPAGESPPYITFGDATVEEWSALDMIGHFHQLALEIWTREGGDTEALTIGGRIADILSSSRVKIDGHSLIDFHIASQSIDPLSSAGITHARLLIEAHSEVLL